MSDALNSAALAATTTAYGVVLLAPNGGTTAGTVVQANDSRLTGGGGGGVTSLAGTANQISVSAATGAVTLSLPSAVTAPGTLSSNGNLTAGNGSSAIEVRAVGDNTAAYGYTLYTGGTYEASLRHTATTGLLKLDVGRNSSWGGAFEIYADTTRAARFTKTTATLDGALTVSSTTNSTSKTSGALIIGDGTNGGLGVSQNGYFGGELFAVSAGGGLKLSSASTTGIIAALQGGGISLRDNTNTQILGLASTGDATLRSSLTAGGTTISLLDTTSANTRIFSHKKTAPALNHIAQVVLAQGVGDGFGANDRTYQLTNTGVSSTATNFILQYWNGSAYSERLKIDSTGLTIIPGAIQLATTNFVTISCDGASAFDVKSSLGTKVTSTTYVGTNTSRISIYRPSDNAYYLLLQQDSAESTVRAFNGALKLTSDTAGVTVTNTNNSSSKITGALVIGDGTNGGLGVGGNIYAGGRIQAGADLVVDSGTGSSNAVLYLTGRNAGAQNIATVYSNFEGSLLLSPKAGQPVSVLSQDLNLTQTGVVVWSIRNTTTSGILDIRNGSGSYLTFPVAAGTVEFNATNSSTVKIASNTGATNTTSGALQVVGGAGIGGAIWAGGEIVANAASNAFRIANSQTPASQTASGTQGQITWDASYLYVCTSTNNWGRSSLNWAGGGGSGGSTNIWIPASEWIPRTTNGCGINSLESTTNRVNYDVLEFDPAAVEYAQAMVVLPNNWNAGTVTAKFHWTAASGSGDVVWQLSGRAYANDDAIDQATGTAQSSTDTLTAANDLDISPATSAITLAGTAANGNPVVFELSRNATAGGDTLGTDARLIGVEITYSV
jgi:hypothetical protein